ncbi:hypothetical protein GCM10023085_72980 [Actinomadura viridis]
MTLIQDLLEHVAGMPYRRRRHSRGTGTPRPVCRAARAPGTSPGMAAFSHAIGRLHAPIVDERCTVRGCRIGW